MEISNDSKIKYWYSTYGLKPKTQHIYDIALRKYCELVGKTPTELINEAISEVKSGKLPYECKFANYIVQFKDKLIADDLAPMSQAVSLTAIKSFYSVYNITVPSHSCRIKHALPLTDNIKNYLTTEDVVKLIRNAASLRDKAMILLMATSGMARNEIINLHIKDITFEKISNTAEIGIIYHIRRQKTSVDYTTFCSPEAVVAIKTYLEERNRIPQNVSPCHYLPLDKLKIKGDNDYLFVDYTYGTKLNLAAFDSIFRRLSDKMGYYGGKGKLRKSRSHALRKYFASTLENAGMPKNKVDYLLGHHRSGNELAYFRVDVEVLKKLYIDYLEFLTFDKVIRIHSIKTEDEKRLAEVETRNKQLEAQMNDMQAILNELLSASRERRQPSISFNRKEDKLGLIDKQADK